MTGKPATDAIIFQYKHRCEELPQDLVTQLLADTGYEAREARDAAFVMARWTYYQRSKAEAARLGLLPHPTEAFRHNPIVLVVEAVGDEAGKFLAQQYGFTWRVADSMWDIIDERRDGDAVLALIGDDRGWSQHHTYWIVVAWSPAELAAELGYTPGLL